ncbi:MAG TPA: ABC transporter substrate-binding protein [Solirubrobacteraceae bacterium]|nr:ABC transporter substrate-binding protein [Solirubrobacteraceae bacterium]
MIGKARRWGSALLLVLAIVPGAAAASYQSPLTESLTGGQRGGVLNVLNEADFEHLDPGEAYYSLDYEVVYATQRPLYSFRPNSLQSVPDLAAGPPRISADAKTVTVMLKHGVRFSPPVNREVTSEDVAYAIERGASPHVANSYLHAYFEAIEGMPHAGGGPIRGIRTPNRHEIVFKLTEPLGQIVADALVLPLTAPVPKSYAQRFDRQQPSDYSAHEVATGPYMLANDRSGKVLGIGYRPGLSATLVRNPNWRRSTDFRPAYLRAIHIKIGSFEQRIGPKVLSSADDVENEPPALSAVKEAIERHPSQLEISPGAGDHYIGIDSARGPFANIDLRKALWAALDRVALDAVRGGGLLASPAGHFLYPTIPGFEEAGGLEGPHGPQFDFDEHPQGDLEVAEKYLRLAGYPGRYTGSQVVSIVGAKGEPAERDAEIVNETVESLGFKTDFKVVQTATMYARYCNVPKNQPDICPSVGWIADFGDPQTVLDITFNGAYINATGNVNWGQTNVPAINEAMIAAEAVVGTAPRASAWARIDDELVEDAAVIPFDWDSQANIEGTRARGVGDLWNVGAWDYSWTSLR